MRIVGLSCAALALLSLSACAAGMNPMGGAVNAQMASSVATSQAQYSTMMQQQAAAQAAAGRPGDQNLSCAQIETEMGVIFNDPAFQASMASMGAEAEAQQAKANAASAAGVGLGAGSVAAGIAGSFIPGVGGLAAQAAMNAQMAAAMSQIPAADASRGRMLGDFGSMMPAMMRGQRLTELAQAKSCPFMQGQSAPPLPSAGRPR